MIRLHTQNALRFLIVMTMLAVVQSTLSVYNMQALEENVPELLNISYSIANFGFAPYGKTIIARLMHSPNYSSECVPDPTSHNYQNSFLLIPRGECEFVTKALNAQQLGAQLAIIADNNQHDQLVMMVDNGYGYKVKIPTIFINHQDGQKLKTLIDRNPANSVMMKIAFENTKTDKVDVTFWLQGNNRHSYRLVSDFRKYYPKIKENINFQLVYAGSACSSCQQRDCYFNKQYCAINVYHNTQTDSGKLILDQQIRQQIVYELYPDQWWHYIKYVELECAIIAELKECGQKGMQKEGIDIAKINDAFQKSFSSDQNNVYLSKNKGILQNSGVTRFPSVTLNNVKVKASLNAEFIFDDICNTLVSPPESCRKYLSETEYREQVSHQWLTLVIVVVIGLSLFSVIFCLYRRYMKKKISFEMQSRVDDMVSKYIQFYSERNGKK